jgi:uncharacterized protein
MESVVSATNREIQFRAHPWLFLGMALGWTWAIWLIIVATGREFTDPAALGLFAIGGLGPAGAAIWLAHREHGREGLRGIWRRLIETRRMAREWYPIIALVVLGPHLAMALIDWAVSGDPAALASAGAFLISPVLIVGTLAFMIVAVIPEEVGWRGYGLDPLLYRFGALPASLILGVVWAIWHLPLYFIPGSFLHDSVGLFTTRYWAINLAIPLLSILHTWIYRGTARSIYSAVVFHIAWNMAGEAFSPDVRADLIRLAALLAVTIIVIMAYGRALAPGPDPAHDDLARRAPDRHSRDSPPARTMR